MRRIWSMIAVLLACFGLSGCASSPWLTAPSTPPASSSTTKHTTAEEAIGGSPVIADLETLQRAMADVRQIGAIDPTAQDRLLEDLRRSDPAIWPLVIQQCRSTLAYRQRAMAQNGLADGRAKQPIGDAAASARPKDCPTTSIPVADEASPWWSKRSSPTPQTVNQNANRGSAGQAASSPSNEIVRASYAAPIAYSWQGQLAAAIAAMEAETPSTANTPEEVARLARLRMLYAAAGRRADAARPIPGAPPATQQFVAKELDGLGAWLDAAQSPDAARRAAEIKPALAEALGKLAESAPLVVRNPTFCKEILSYGCTKRFDKYEFAANQEVLLYAEIENFATEATLKGYHTSLQSSYQIIDSHGSRVAEHKFPATEEHCQNLRRDFFIGYHLRLPKQLAPGHYTLRLSIEDLKCHKTGHAVIEFSIRKADK